MYRRSKQFTALILAFIFSFSANAKELFPNGPRIWDYNGGPDPKTVMGRKVIDIYAELPDFEEMSEAVTNDQVFRPAFGMMMTRTRFEEDAVKILFIGQDATHVAEVAKQPGTSGFGGRVQSIGNFFGVDQGVTTTNAYLATIRKQYGTFSQVYVDTSKGAPKLYAGSYVDNELWAISNHPKSNILQKREQYWEWLLQNNPNNLKLIVTFGGAARDAFAEFLIARGFQVRARKNANQLKNIRIPESKLKYAGGNNAFPVAIDANGKDLNEKYLLAVSNDNKDVMSLEKIMDLPSNEKAKAGMISDFDRELVKKLGSVQGKAKAKATPEKDKLVVDYSVPEIQTESIKALQAAGEKAINEMVFTAGGINGSGMVNAAQLGGYDLNQVYNNKGEKTVSLKGLKLSDGTVISHDIGFAQSTHPTALSKMEDDEASESLRKAFEPLESLKAKGWKVDPDVDDKGKLMTNNWDDDASYAYGRADIGPWYFAFGDPDDRRAARADAVRPAGDTQVIVVGTRNAPRLDAAIVEKLKNNTPSEPKNPNDLWTVRPRTGDSRYEFDLGPGIDVARALLESLSNREEIFAAKKDQKVFGSIDRNGKVTISKQGKGSDITFEVKGIAAYNAKTIGETGFFGFHRGDFKTARTLILADPHGLDDWLTGRALTGTRGQYLNGFMNDLGYGSDYLVIKTVPFGMDGASREEWTTIRQQTEKYRETALSIALQNKNIKEVFTDGPNAVIEMKRILTKLKRNDIIVVNMKRNSLREDHTGDMKAAAVIALQKIPRLKGQRVLGQRKDLPRIHLPWWSRIWEGTGGDSVMDAPGLLAGGVRAVVAPNWAVNQDPEHSPDMKQSIQFLQDYLETSGVRMDTEPLSKFLKRKSLGLGSLNK
jgi:hypothetical protein